MWNDEAYSRRHSLRLRGFDYTSAGAYFVTLCVADRACFLGEIVDGAMCLNPLGRIVAESWLALPTRFPVIKLDAFVVMPNHFHGIIILNEIHVPPAPSGSVGAKQAPPADKQSATPSLSQVIQAFKSISAIACNRASGRTGLPFWQRGYHDRIIRDDHELQEIRAYIASNPARWTEDDEYPFGDW
jgi:putative transposase